MKISVRKQKQVKTAAKTTTFATQKVLVLPKKLLNCDIQKHYRHVFEVPELKSTDSAEITDFFVTFDIGH